MEEPLPSQLTTPVDALYAHLDLLEKLLESPLPNNVEELLVTLDAANTEIGILDASQAQNPDDADSAENADGADSADDADKVSNLDLADAHERWDSILITLRARPQLISVPARGFPGGMNALRDKHRPATGFWWRADKARADQQRNQLIRAVILLLIAAAVIWGLAWLWSY